MKKTTTRKASHGLVYSYLLFSKTSQAEGNSH